MKSKIFRKSRVKAVPGKAVILFGLFLLIFTTTLVMAFSPDDYYIKKQGNIIYVYEKTHEYSTEDLTKEQTKLIKDINDLDFLINSTDVDCGYCLNEFELGYWGSIEECETECFNNGVSEEDKISLEQIKEKKLEELDEINYIADEGGAELLSSQIK